MSIGMVAQVKLANKLGYMTEEEVEAVVKLLNKAKLPTRIPYYIDREKLVKKLYTDKKVKNGQLRFVVQKGRISRRPTIYFFAKSCQNEYFDLRIAMSCSVPKSSFAGFHSHL